jgi:hypothetical protein
VNYLSGNPGTRRTEHAEAVICCLLMTAARILLLELLCSVLKAVAVDHPPDVGTGSQKGLERGTCGQARGSWQVLQWVYCHSLVLGTLGVASVVQHLQGVCCSAM